jgi:hypothetical protein
MSEARLVGTHQQPNSVVAIQSVPVAGADLPIMSESKSLGVIIDSQLSFSSYVIAVCRACNVHIQALSHIRDLLSPEVA